MKSYIYPSTKQFGGMKSVKEVDNIHVKVLLQPDYIALRSMENLKSIIRVLQRDGVNRRAAAP